MVLSLGAKLFGSAGAGLTRRMAVGGLAGAILGDDGGDVLMGAALGAVAPSRAATKGFLKEGKLFGKTNETLGQWGKTASKIPWKRGMVGAGVAGLGITANAIANSKFVDQYYTSYYGAGPETERTLESIKGVGRATMATGIIGGGLYGLTGISPISPFRAGKRAAMKVVGGAQATPGFARGVMGMKEGGRVGQVRTQIVPGVSSIHQRGYAAGQRFRAGAAQWSPFGGSRMVRNANFPGQGVGELGSFTAGGRTYQQRIRRQDIFSSQKNIYGRNVRGEALHSPLANRLFGSKSVQARGVTDIMEGSRVGTGILSTPRRTGRFLDATKRGAAKGWRAGTGPIKRHPYWTGAAVGGALGAGGGFFAAGRAAQARGPGSGRIIGMDSGAGGMNPSMNFTTQGLGLNIHNRRRRRTLVD